MTLSLQQQAVLTREPPSVPQRQLSFMAVYTHHAVTLGPL